jgi:hypothetical protein
LTLNFNRLPKEVSVYRFTVVVCVAVLAFLFTFFAATSTAQSDRGGKVSNEPRREIVSHKESKHDHGSWVRHLPQSRKGAFRPGRTDGLIRGQARWPLDGAVLGKETIIDDFVVNDDVAGGCRQLYPAVGRGPGGNYVVAWSDERDASSSVYARIYDAAGFPVGNSFRVNEEMGGSNPKRPAVAEDSSGDFVITWSSIRDSGYEVLAQRFNSTGNPQGSNFRVNEESGNPEWQDVDVAMDAEGNFVIAWTDSRDGSLDIFAQRYNSAGTPVGANFKVNTDGGPESQDSPAVAMNQAGDFVITWGDNRYHATYAWEIYVQRYNAAGIPQGGNMYVNDDMGSNQQFSPDVGLDDYGNFVVTWHDERDYATSRQDIYGQRFDSLGTRLGTNFRISDDPGDANQWSPAVAVDFSGDFVVTWEDERNDATYGSEIYAQRYDSSGAAQGVNFCVNTDAGDEFQGTSAVAADSPGNFIIAWTDARNGFHNIDIYAQRYDFSGFSQGTNVMINDDVGSAHQENASVAMAGSGDFVITWTDYRADSSLNVYAQRYGPSGAPAGSNFMVNFPEGTVSTYVAPTAAMDALGNFIIAWEDDRNSSLYGSEIYAQRYDDAGNPLGVNFYVNDDEGNDEQDSPSAAMDASGNFIITWRDHRNSDIYGTEIYAQRYDNTGSLLGANFYVNTDVGSANQSSPDVAMNASHGFVTTWADERNGPTTGRDIYAQRYDASGLVLDTNFRVNDDAGSDWQNQPVVAMDGSGRFIVAWTDGRNVGYDIYAQRYNSSGTAQGPNFKVNDDAGPAIQWAPDIAAESSGNFVITWYDERGGNADAFAQKYGSNGEPLGANYLVPHATYASLLQESPAVAANGSNICYAWTDNRRGKGLDIFAKLADWEWSEVEEEHQVNQPHSFQLSQNYPNPFNPTTRIAFSLPKPVHVKLEVLNLLGQKVKVMIDQRLGAGRHSVEWDGTDDSGSEVASGVYFYRIKAGDFSQAQKMLMLK